MKYSFRKVCASLHLWLGLISGIIVFIVCVTGALYVFKDEIIAATQPWRFVAAQHKTQLPPSYICHVAGKAAQTDTPPSAVTYGQAGDAAWVDYFLPDGHGSFI